MGSLDAPTVAAVWTWFIARCSGILLPWTDLAAMFIAVWTLYAADRLLDARSLACGRVEGLEARHLFHHQHRSTFHVGIVAGCLILSSLLPTLGWLELKLYLVLGGLLAAWLVVVHTARKTDVRPLPKEVAVGVFFAAAVFVPTLARTAESLKHWLMPAALLGALCSLNTVCIFAWERGGSPAHRSTELAADRVLWLTAGLAMTAAWTAIWSSNEWKWLHGAVAFSALLLLLLHRARKRVERTTLRALADIALLTPLLAVLWMR